MPLVTVVITLIAVGILLWGINTFIPLDPDIKKIIKVVVIVGVVVWLCSLFGVFSHLSSVHVGR